MKSRRRILLAVMGLVVVAVVVAALWPEDHGPSYQGVTLEIWLQRYALDRSPAAVDAVRHIGTNGLPFLLKRIEHELPAWKKRLPTYVPRGLWGPGRPIWMWVFADKQGARADRANLGFEILGEEAAPAIPALTDLLRHREREGTSLRALRAVSKIGTKECLVIVAGIVTNTSYSFAHRGLALAAIAGTNAPYAVPVLVAGLNDSKGSQMVLQDMKVQPDIVELVLPTLIKCLRSEQQLLLPERAADALGELGTIASDAVPDLLVATTNANRNLRIAATNALQKIEPAEPAVLKK